MRTLTVACVLVPSETYTVDWVLALREQVDRYLRLRHRFVCLTTIPEEVDAAGIEALPLVDGWPGWWSKIELFRPELFRGPVLYLDLDVLVQGPLDDLVRETDGFDAADDFFAPGFLNSSVMTWCGDYKILYQVFQRSAPRLMKEFRTGRNCRIGDQAYIEHTLKRFDMPFRLMSRERIASFKLTRGVRPHSARIVCFHGAPKMPDAAGWPRDEWNRWLTAAKE